MYLCEQRFLTLLNLKTKHQSWLNVEYDISMHMSNTIPRSDITNWYNLYTKVEYILRVDELNIVFNQYVHYWKVFVMLMPLPYKLNLKVI